MRIKSKIDLDLIRRDLVLKTFRNKFSYLNDFTITSRYIINRIDRVTAPILNYFLTSTPLDSYHLFFSLYSLYITMTTENTNELNYIDNHIINVINQLKTGKKELTLMRY